MVRPATAATSRRCSTSAPISIREPRWATRATIPNQIARPRVNAEHMSGYPVSIQHQRHSCLLSESSLQRPRSYRTNSRQAQTIQAHRTALREDSAELRFVRCACSRLHLDQIRPHGQKSRRPGFFAASFKRPFISRAISNVYMASRHWSRSVRGAVPL